MQSLHWNMIPVLYFLFFFKEKNNNNFRDDDDGAVVGAPLDSVLGQVVLDTVVSKSLII